MARVLRYREDQKEEILATIIEALAQGQIVAIPTETFYGLAADPAQEKALKRLFQLKRRPVEKPILLLIGSLRQLEELVSQISPLARKLINRFWPGPLTLVFPAREGLSALITARTGKVAVRFSSHPLAQELARLFGPLTGTSANLSGQPPACTAEEVLEMIPEVDLVLDGGKSPGELPSTIIDVSVSPPLLLREGKLPWKELERALREEDPQ